MGIRFQLCKVNKPKRSTWYLFVHLQICPEVRFHVIVLTTVKKKLFGNSAKVNFFVY